MSNRTAARLAWSIWALCVPLTTFGGLLSFLTASGQLGAGSGLAILLGVLLLTFPTVGALVASRRPENPIGWIFCAAGLVFSVGIFAESYAKYALHASSAPLFGVQFAAWLSSWTGPGLLLAAAFLFLLFPDGRLPSRRWRLVAWMAAIGSSLSALGVAFEPGPLEANRSIANPVGIGGTLGGVVEVLGVVGAVVLNVGVLLSGISLILRLRRARGVQRQQLKWFVYSAVMMGSGFAASILFSSGLANSIAWTLGILGFMVLPVATGIALLRYRLYDIDALINRTLVYGALTASLIVIYLGGIAVLQGMFRALTGQESSLAVVASTLVIAALFSPFRHRLQGFIDRGFYRKKYDAARTLESFSTKLRDETDLDSLGDDLVAVVRETVQPEHASLWLRLPERER
ncbi:MAG: hypothetical protein M3533_15765 [Actinomycetota bacterium]|nr:hypothetical protein [Actinomycetota bacterium]